MNVFDFAATAHDGQYRKGFTAHFITHPLAVASIVMEYSGQSIDSEIVHAALLHDVVEDTSFTSNELARRYGHYVAALVAVVTHNPAMRGKQKRLAYIRSLSETKLHEAVLISCADKLDNLRSIRHQQLVDSEGAQEFKNGMWFYDSLLPIYRRVLPEHFQDANALLTIFDDALSQVKQAYGLPAA